MRRPDVFTLDYSHPLAQGLVFAGLGQMPWAGRYDDASSFKNTASLVGFEQPSAQWLRDESIGRYAVRSSEANNFIQMPSEVNAPTKPPIQLGIGGWFWITHSVNSEQLITNCDETELGYFGATLTKLGTNALNVRVGNSAGLYSSGRLSFNSYSTIPEKKWVHLWANIRVVSNNGFDVYLNGVLAQGSYSGTATSLAYTTSPGRVLYSATPLDSRVSDPLVYNRVLSPAEIALLADRTDPMLGGLIVEERPVLYFDMGGSSAVEGPAVITAESTLALIGKKGAVCPATVSASASLGMGGVKGASAPLNIVGTASVEASGQKVVSSPATIAAESALGMGGIKTILGLDKEGPAVIAASASVGMGGIKGAAGQVWIGADSELVAAGVKGGVGSAAWLATGSFGAGKAPDVTEITAAEVARIVRATSRMKTVTASARVKQVRYEVTRA